MLVQFDDAFLDRVFRHQAVNRDGTQLPHAVGAVRGLVFHGRIPPRIHVDHVIGCRQIDAHAARLQADQENIAFSRLEGIHPALALLHGRTAVEILVADAMLLQMLADQGQMVDELAEDEHLVAVFQQARQQLREGCQLAAGQAQLRCHQLRIAAGTAQLHDFRQDLDGFFRRRPFHHGQLFQRFAAQGFVQRRFLRRQFHFQHDFRA